MDKIFTNYRETFTDKKILFDMFIGVLLFIFGLVVAYYAYAYTQTYQGTIAQDIFLDNLPIVNVALLFFGGMAFMGVVAVVLSLLDPKRIPFVLISTGLFFAVRGFFLILTHLAPPNIEYYQYIQYEHHIKNVVFTLSSGTDLFFSGHVGYAFLLTLIFWYKKYLRYFFLLFSFLMAGVVILGHLHYSIDVFSAYFIVFGIFEFAKKYFHKEYVLLFE
ncbi:MAG: phosphatase PAP2-related protein [Candidatus Nomurabacteria bacterium]